MVMNCSKEGNKEIRKFSCCFDLIAAVLLRKIDTWVLLHAIHEHGPTEVSTIWRGLFSYGCVLYFYVRRLYK